MGSLRGAVFTAPSGPIRRVPPSSPAADRSGTPRDRLAQPVLALQQAPLREGAEDALPVQAANARVQTAQAGGAPDHPALVGVVAGERLPVVHQNHRPLAVAPLVQPGAETPLAP